MVGSQIWGGVVSGDREILGIQTLRGFAAIGVVIAHGSEMVGLPKYYKREPFGGLLQAGVSGVDLFFVISGFIIAIVSLQGRALQPVVTRRAFLARRAARILPLMWLAIVFFVLLRIVGTPDRLEPWAHVRAMLLLPYGTLEPGHLWTLRHEFVFYIVFAWSFLGAPRMRWMMAGWVALSIIISVFVGKLDIGSIHRVLFGMPAIEFGAGLLLGMAWVRSPWPSNWQIGVHPLIVLLLGTVAMLAVGLIVGNGLVAMIVLAGSSALLIALATRLACPPDALTAFGKLLGDASYAIYLFHIHFLSLLLVMSVRIAPGAPPVLALVIVTVAATALGVGIHLVVERPLVRWAQRKLLGRRAERVNDVAVQRSETA